MLPKFDGTRTVTCDTCVTHAGHGDFCYNPSESGIPEGWSVTKSAAFDGDSYFYSCSEACRASIVKTLRDHGRTVTRVDDDNP